MQKKKGSGEGSKPRRLSEEEFKAWERTEQKPVPSNRRPAGPRMPRADVR